MGRIKEPPHQRRRFLEIQISNDTAMLQEVFREIMSEPYEEDGVLFDTSEVEAENIAGEEPYASTKKPLIHKIRGFFIVGFRYRFHKAT